MQKTSITQNLPPDAWVNTIRYAIIATMSENLPPDAKTRASSRLKNLAKGRAQENAMLKSDGNFCRTKSFPPPPKVWSKSYRSSNHTGGTSDRKGIISASNNKGHSSNLNPEIKPRCKNQSVLASAKSLGSTGSTASRIISI